ncbi:ABC transporter permease [Pseudonocardia lacus]|uniref:ABC transporter permease n=1 Tax=Pseudonocardia lacus TaxID=2835865 RepID=UPI0027E234CB|nr:ABC transporter permease [Pseudonocardia lacus]
MTATVDAVRERATPARGRRRTTSWLAGFAQRWAVFVAAVAVWQVAAASAASAFFPPPSRIAQQVWDGWLVGESGRPLLTDVAIDNLLPSLGRMFGSWLIAVVVGVTLGIALGRSAKALDYVGPLLAFFRAIPPPVLAPVFLLVFNLGTPMQVATIVFGVIWPLILNSVDGARSVDPTQYATARAFRLPRRQWVFGVVVPAALPKVFAGLRVSLSLALILMVISELLGAVDGLGYQLNIAKSSFDFPAMWAVVVLLGVLGYLFNSVLLVVERRVLRWQPGRK